jgi:hypothetical protein
MVGKTKGRDGGMIRDVSALGFEVQEDGVVKIPVQVTTENGTYTSYISDLRGIDENDNPKQFSTEELVGKAATLGQLASIMESSGVSGQMQQRASDYYASQKEPVKGNYEQVKNEVGGLAGSFNKNNGVFKPSSQEDLNSQLSQEEQQQIARDASEKADDDRFNSFVKGIQDDENISAEAKPYAKQIVNKANEILAKARAEGRRIDGNAVTLQAVNEVMATVKSTAEAREKFSQQATKGIASYNNSSSYDYR